MEKWRDRRMLNKLAAQIDSHKNEVLKLEKCTEYFQVMNNDERKAFIKNYNRGNVGKFFAVVYLGVAASIGGAVIFEKATGWVLNKIEDHKKNNKQEESEEIEA